MISQAGLHWSLVLTLDNRESSQHASIHVTSADPKDYYYNDVPASRASSSSIPT
jgi:lysozyme family protein